MIKNGRGLGYSYEKLQVLEAYIPPTLKIDDKDIWVKTVIDDLGTAEIFFSAKLLYATNMYCRDKMKNYDIVERDKHMHRLSTYIHEYEKMDSGTKYIWEEKCRKNLDQHPYIKDSIVNTLF